MLCAVAAASPCTTSMAGTTVMAKAPPMMLMRYRAPAVLASWRGDAPVSESITAGSRLEETTCVRGGRRIRPPAISAPGHVLRIHVTPGNDGEDDHYDEDRVGGLQRGRV